MSKTRNLSNTLNGGQTIENDTQSTGLTIKEYTTQTTNAIELNDNSGSLLNGFDPNGTLIRFDIMNDWGETYQDLGDVSGAVSIDISISHVVKMNVVGEVTSFNIDNPNNRPATQMVIHLSTNGNAINWDTGGSPWVNGIDNWIGEKPGLIASGNYLMNLTFQDDKWIALFNETSSLSLLPFKMTMRTIVPNEEIFLPFKGNFSTGGAGEYDCHVEWGDDTADNYDRPPNTYDEYSHVYADAGYHTISIYGTMTSISFESSLINGGKLISIDAWGQTGLNTLDRSFFHCDELISVASGSFKTGDTSEVESMVSAFSDCYSLVDFPSLDFSKCKYFSQAWRNCGSLTTFPAGIFDNVDSLDYRQTFYICNLDQESVDNIIVSVDTGSLDGITYGGILDIVDGGNSPPGDDGIEAKESLESRSWTVYTN